MKNVLQLLYNPVLKTEILWSCATTGSCKSYLMNYFYTFS